MNGNKIDALHNFTSWSCCWIRTIFWVFDKGWCSSWTINITHITIRSYNSQFFYSLFKRTILGKIKHLKIRLCLVRLINLWFLHYINIAYTGRSPCFFFQLVGRYLWVAENLYHKRAYKFFKMSQVTCQIIILSGTSAVFTNYKCFAKNAKGANANKCKCTLYKYVLNRCM